MGVEHGVYPIRVRGADGLRHVPLAVVHGFGGADLLQEVAVPGTGRADRARPPIRGQLDGEGADPTGSADYQDGLAFGDLQLLYNGLPGGQPHKRQGGGMDKVHRAGPGPQLLGGLAEPPLILPADSDPRVFPIKSLVVASLMPVVP